MHILENYALTSGCYIDRCYIEEEYIELPKNKYVTIHPYNPKGSSRQYKYWQEVIDLLNSNINFDYTIVQIGGRNDIKYNNIDISYLGKTTYNSLAYLVKNTSMHIGYDSFPVHLASHYNRKIIALYPHYRNNTGPYFSKSDEIILIESDHSKIKPVFSENDPFDQINSILPQNIYRSILQLLGLLYL